MVIYLYMNYRFGSTPMDIGLYISFHGTVNAVVQGLLMRRIIPHICSEESAAWYGLLCIGLNVTGYCFCVQVWQMYLVSLVFAPGAMYLPAVKALLVQEGLKQEGAILLQGNLQGVLNSVNTLSMACAGLVYNELFSYGVRREPWPIPFLPFSVAGALFFLSLWTLHLSLRTSRAEDEQMRAQEDAMQKEVELALDEEFIGASMTESDIDD